MGKVLRFPGLPDSFSNTISMHGFINAAFKLVAFRSPYRAKVFCQQFFKIIQLYITDLSHSYLFLFWKYIFLNPSAFAIQEIARFFH